ncbi:hypothetical protein MPSEU_000113000 [Mayamaea pseudoterrestris]|nr:hypothetical protein MPSEU_000113000 [Mayamaea pseudoterrestris]
MILRVRLPDGSLEKLAVDPDSTNKVSLRETLSLFSTKIGTGIVLANDDQDKLNIQTQATMRSPMVNVEDPSLTLHALGLKHGSIVSLTQAKRNAANKQSSTIPNSSEQKQAVWNPFPDLAKHYGTVARKRRSSKQRLGKFSDLVDRQAQLHTVEPQPHGHVKRVYMCRISAERFRNSCAAGGVGLLLGTLAKERVNLHRRRAKTSLSNTTEQEEYCQVTKVQTLVPLPSSLTNDFNEYDASRLIELLARDNDQSDKKTASILRVANWLGLHPVGWIFMYHDDRLNDDDSLPVLASDVQVAAQLQLLEMKATHRGESSRAFCTLAMDANSGATDAFQLSNVSVQMQAEGLFAPSATKQMSDKRLIHTKHPVLVDGQEVNEFDSVLCLVNTALLSHDGAYAKATDSVKKSGLLKKKTKKALLHALDANDDAALMELLSDFNLLVTLDEWLGPSDSEALCKAIKQKRGAGLDAKLKDSVRSILETH